MKKLLMALWIAGCAFAVQANPEGYFMLAVHSPGELPTPQSDIYGMRLSLIYGDCQNLNGLDVSLAGRIRERVNGLQIGILYSIDDADLNGLGAGIVNYAAADCAGLQAGGWNHAGFMAGLQAGIVNTAGTCDGCQIGLLNFASNLSGCQIGLSNYAGNMSVAWLPILNVGW